jgi:hypothetical protein
MAAVREAYAVHPPLEGEGRRLERSESRRGGVNFVHKIHPTPLASLATLPLQGRVGACGSLDGSERDESTRAHPKYDPPLTLMAWPVM